MPYNAEQNQIDNQNQDPNGQQSPDNQQGATNLAGSGGPGGAAGSGRVAMSSSGSTQPAGSGGSGRYTNLQKYLGANQGATDRLYQGITKRIDQTTQGQRQEAQTQADKVREGINQGSQALQRGTGYYNQLQDQNFNAQDFASDQNRLDDYTKFRTGSAIDTNALGQQNTAAQTANLQAQNQYGERLGQVGTEGGRFDLLKETFGGRGNIRPTYSAGNQRLDQLFLQAGAGNKVGQLQNDLRGNVNALGQQLSTLQGDVANNITGLGRQQTDLSGNIQNRSNFLEGNYINNLQNQVGGINAARDAERKRYNDFVQQILSSGQGKETSQALDEALFNEAQLRNGEQVFNAFKNPTLTTQQFQNIDTRNANDYRDIANQQNVDYYSALSKIAGINNSKLDKTGMLVDPATGQLVRAATLKQGEGGLRNTVDKAQDDFIKYALGANIVGTGEDSGTSGLFGSGGTATSQMSLNLAKYLRENNLLPSGTTGLDGQANYAQMAGSVLGNANPVGMAGLAANALMPGSAIGQLGATLTNAPGQIAGQLASNFGLTGNGGSSVAANARARQNLLDNLTSTLKGQGYNNYLTKSGVKGADDLAQANRDIESNRLSARNDNQFYTNPLQTGDQQAQFMRNEQARQLLNMTGYNPSDVKSSYTADDISKLQNRYADYVTNYNTSNGGWYNGQLIDRMSPEAKAKWRADVINNTANLGRNVLDQTLASRQATEDKYNNQIAANQAALRQRLGLPDISLNDFEGGLNGNPGGPAGSVGTGGTIKNSAPMSLAELQRRFAGK